MKPKSILLELFPGNSSSNNYRDCCSLADINYNNLRVDIKEGTVEDFRNCKVVLNPRQIIEIKRKCLLL